MVTDTTLGSEYAYLIIFPQSIFSFVLPRNTQSHTNLACVCLTLRLCTLKEPSCSTIFSLTSHISSKPLNSSSRSSLKVSISYLVTVIQVFWPHVRLVCWWNEFWCMSVWCTWLPSCPPRRRLCQWTSSSIVPGNLPPFSLFPLSTKPIANCDYLLPNMYKQPYMISV